MCRQSYVAKEQCGLRLCGTYFVFDLLNTKNLINKLALIILLLICRCKKSLMQSSQYASCTLTNFSVNYYLTMLRMQCGCRKWKQSFLSFSRKTAELCLV